MSFLTKVNIILIVKHHYGTFRSMRTERPSVGDWTVQVALPALAGVAIVCLLDITISQDLASIIITSLSIFAALLLNLLLLIYTVVRQRPTEPPDGVTELSDADRRRHRLRVRFLKEIYANISYGILLSVVIILVLVGLSVVNPDGASVAVAVRILSTVAWFGTIQFLAVLLMVLKRVYSLLHTEAQSQA